MADQPINGSARQQQLEGERRQVLFGFMQVPGTGPGGGRLYYHRIFPVSSDGPS